ncbi:MAG: hypothetical protein C5B53_11635 [Candidatus Melainabacteria bacterium]|nr:MAG: hypothetical protein C5B53_11635 [Candidatus Melainabacteria bacterium]
MSRKAFLLRIDQKLYDDLEAWAQQEMRSVNGQIEYLLKQSISRHLSTSQKATESSRGRPQSGREKESN